jgi:hypothetical protein
MGASAVDPILTAVATRLQAKNGIVALSGTTLQAPEVDDLLGAIGLTELDITVTGNGIAQTADAVIVAGNATVFGWTVEVTTTFTVADGALCAALHAGFPDDARVKVLGLSWATVEGLALDMSVAGPADPLAVVTAELSGKIALDGVKNPIAVSLRPSFGQALWVLRASDIPLPDPVAVLKTLLNDDGPLLPSKFTLDGFKITDLAIAFDPSAETFHSLDLTLGTTAPGTAWHIADGLPDLSRIYLSCGLAFAEEDSGSEPSVRVAAGARIDFPSGPKLPVRVAREPSQWRVGILGAHDFPSAADLVKAIAPTTADSLPSALKTLRLDSASVDLVLGSDGSLRSTFFAARLKDDWMINSHLTFTHVAMELLIADGMTGFFAGTVVLDGVAIPVSVRKASADAPLTLRLATAAAPSLKGVSSLSNAAGGADLTTHVPSGAAASAIELRNLSVTFDAKTYAPSTLDVDVHTGPWSVPGLDGLSVRDLAVTLHAGWPGPTVSGSLSGTVDIPGAGIAVTATKAADWQFSVALVPPPGGTAVQLEQLVDAFAKGATPAALRGATVKTASGTFDTNGAFSLDLAGHLAVDSTPLDLELKVARTAGGQKVSFHGEVTVAKRKFTVDVSSETAETKLVASYSHDQDLSPIDLGALLAEISSPAPDIHLTVDVKDATFALGTDANATHAAFGLDLANIDLSGLPLVGKALGDAAKVEELRVVAGDLAFWNAVVPTTQVPAQGHDPSVVVSGRMAFGDTSAPLALPADTATSSGKTTTTARAAADGTKWFAVQRSFGPVHLDRVGARYDAGALWLVLDGSLALGGLSLSLMGLGVGSSLSNFDPRFHLDGLGLAFAAGGVEIAGSFLVVPGKDLAQKEFEYDGAAVVRAESFTLSAIGSYAEVKGHPSLFIFAEFDSPLGGPPAFYVTGLVGGFGYNRALRIPAQDEVHQFPFLQGLDTKLGDGTPLGALGVLEGGEKPWLTEGTGDNWLAVGVTFTSFELVHSRALLVAEFGHELQFALIGLSKLRLPQDESSKAFAYVELELEAVLKPQEGFFGLTARLSPNSFVIAPDCRLTGGFAFYVWFDGEHAGDFVLTLGGYHPAFDLDAYPWYPREPRLGLSWPVNELVTVAGEAYFALTPSCVMGGGALRVLFHDGNLQAWLTASADFLISWKPFHYRIEVGVSIGVSYRLDLGFVQKTLSVELGARLELWGPPTGGRAHISWYFISFDIAFGAAPAEVPGVEKWSDFEPLLPAGDLCKLSCQSGLLAGAAADGDWIVRADALRLASECAIPANKLELATGTTPEFTKPEQAPAIRPLRVSQLDATHTLHVKDPAGHEIALHEKDWNIEARTRHVPAALWGAPLKDSPTKKGPPTPLPAADLVHDQWVGFVLSPPSAKAPPTSLGVDMATALKADPLEPGGTLPLAETAAPAPGAPAEHAVEAVGGIAAAAPARAAIRSVLGAQKLDPGTDDPLDGYAKATATLFPTAPMLTGKAA